MIRKLIIALLLASGFALAQSQVTYVYSGASVPVTCPATNRLFVQTVTGKMYNCPVAQGPWVLVGGGGVGTSVTVNGGAPPPIANFNDTTPPAPPAVLGDNRNVVWQQSGNNISGYVPDDQDLLIQITNLSVSDMQALGAYTPLKEITVVPGPDQVIMPVFAIMEVTPHAGSSASCGAGIIGILWESAAISGNGNYLMGETNSLLSVGAPPNPSLIGAFTAGFETVAGQNVGNVWESSVTAPGSALVIVDSIDTSVCTAQATGKIWVGYNIIQNVVVP